MTLWHEGSLAVNRAPSCPPRLALVFVPSLALLPDLQTFLLCTLHLDRHRPLLLKMGAASALCLGECRPPGHGQSLRRPPGSLCASRFRPSVWAPACSLHPSLLSVDREHLSFSSSWIGCADVCILIMMCFTPSNSL